MVEVGIFESLFHVSSIAFEVPTGIVADLYGRKLSRILSVLIGIGYFLILLFASSFLFIALGFILLGLSYTFESGSGEALVYDTLKQLNKEATFTKFNGRKEVIYQLAATLSLFAGGMIASISFELNFMWMVGVYLIALIFLICMVEVNHKVDESLRLRTRFKHHFIDSTKTVLKQRKLFNLIVIGALISAPITTVFFFAQDYFQTLGYSKVMIGTFLALHSLLAALGGLSAYLIEKKVSEKHILTIVPFFILLCFTMMVFPVLYTIGFIVVGFFDSVFFVVMANLINQITPSSKRATILSFSGFAFSLVMIVIFPLVGLIVDVYTMKTANLVLLGIVLSLYIVLIFLLKHHSFNPLKQEETNAINH
jgi:MFS family permease